MKYPRQATSQRNEVYLANSSGDLRAWHWHGYGSVENLKEDGITMVGEYVIRRDNIARQKGRERL